MKRLFVAITILFCSLPIMASLSLRHIYYTHNDHLGSASWITDNGTKPVQYLHYLPYGQLLANQQLYTYDERFKFIGKERDQESGYDFFGARYFISPFKHWGSPDPLSDRDPGISSYAYCRWNPIRLVDPDGLKPVYDTDGNFLGTDDKGLQGEAIVMDSKLFQQGMPSDQANTFNLGTDYLSETTKEVMSKHYRELSNRPDWDGKLTLLEANDWYRHGNGNPLFVDASKIDISPLKKADFPNIGTSIYVNFLNPQNLNIGTGLVYGTIQVTLINNDGIVRFGNPRGLLDIYNFDMQSGRFWRNQATKIGSVVAGNGMPFKIYSYGQGKLR